MKSPIITLSSEEISRFDSAAGKEWLITNGLGGYASSTVPGLNTRKYHGSLVAALHPPGDRTVCLSKLDEDIIVNDKVYRFGVNEFHDSLFPRGHLFLKEFSISPFPTFIYEAENFDMKKIIVMPYRKNLVVTLYSFKNRSHKEAKIRIYPLVTCRHFHTVLSRRETQLAFSQEREKQDVTLTFVNPKTTIITRSTAGEFIEKPNWVEGLQYREENARGESAADDCYQPGYYEINLNANGETKLGVVVSANENRKQAAEILNMAGHTTVNFEGLMNTQLQRYNHFLESFFVSHQKVPVTDWLKWILLATDSFVVHDNNEKRSVIAGYFWFESWGRDTFVSLPGLMLVTNRFEDARHVLLDFSRYCRKGLIPNIILDQSGHPLYNTVDGTLWYINAVFQYLKYTGDLKFVREELWSTLKSIIENHQIGTDFEIKLEIDGLLAHGARLTWMDASIEGEAVTPREGKAVEIQALWYNALRIMQLLANKFNKKWLAKNYASMADHTYRTFNEKFWNKDKDCLFDVINNSLTDSSMRPNQIMAVSMDFTMLDKEKNAKIVDVVQREFLTPRGLRTLSRNDPRYKKTYNGSMSARDQAYHNGTVWPWLLGPFVTAYFKAKGHNDQTIEFISKNVIRPLLEEQIHEGGLGTVNEIFDGEPPHTPRGCIAQAWSVAEPLRAYIEDVMQIRPEHEKEMLMGLGV